MQIKATLSIGALAAGTVLAFGSAVADKQPARGAASLDPALARHIAAWPEVSRKAATAMATKYGPPAGRTDTMLVWNGNGSWKRTIVHRQPVDHHFPMKHQDVLEQFIDYEVPVDRFDELAAYDGSVIAARTNGELAARCDNEAMNFLAINLAVQVAGGEQGVDRARKTYARTAMAFKQGKKDELTQRFTFTVPKGGTGDPDRPADSLSRR